MTGTNLANHMKVGKYNTHIKIRGPNETIHM